jgi:hypothetical protein
MFVAEEDGYYGPSPDNRRKSGGDENSELGGVENPAGTTSTDLERTASQAPTPLLTGADTAHRWSGARRSTERPKSGVAVRRSYDPPPGEVFGISRCCRRRWATGRTPAAH